MVIPEQMQHAVDQQLVESHPNGNICMFRLPGAGVHGNDHITQQFRVNIRMVPLAHREGDDIGRTCVLKIRRVEFGNTDIVYDYNRKFAFRAVQGV
jgi:hypothetical protein